MGIQIGNVVVSFWCDDTESVKPRRLKMRAKLTRLKTKTKRVVVKEDIQLGDFSAAPEVGLSFFMKMDGGYIYNTSVVKSIEANRSDLGIIIFTTLNSMYQLEVL